MDSSWKYKCTNKTSELNLEKARNLCFWNVWSIIFFPIYCTGMSWVYFQPQHWPWFEPCFLPQSLLLWVFSFILKIHMIFLWGVGRIRHGRSVLFVSQHPVTSLIRPDQGSVHHVMEASDPLSWKPSACTADVFWHSSHRLPASLMPHPSRLTRPMTMANS